MVKKTVAALLVCLCLAACSAPTETGGILGQASGLEEEEVLLTVDVIIGEISGVIMGRKFDNELEVPLFAPRQA